MNKFNLNLHPALFNVDTTKTPEGNDRIETVGTVVQNTQTKLNFLDKEVRGRIRYDNLPQDQYGKQSADLLDVTISKRKEEDIAIADILLGKDRPSQDEAKLFNTLKNQTLALMVLEEISKGGIADIKDINNLILSYYGNNKDQMKNDAGRIALLAKSVNLSNLVEQLRKEREMLSFVRGIKNWNTMTNVLSYVLNNNLADKLGNITKEDIDSDKTIMEIYGKNRFLVNEKSRILRILNNASKEDIQKIIDIKGRNGDVREAFNVKQMLKENESLIDSNPFLLISDLNSTGSLDRSADGMRNNHRWTEQQMYATFLSLADTKDVKVEGEEDAQKQIIAGPKTTELIKGFARLLKGTVYESDKIAVKGDDETFNNFKQFLKNNPDSIAMYRQRLDKLSYNRTVDLRDLLTARGQESLSNRKEEIAKVELNEIRDERKVWFEEQIKGDLAAKEWYESLSAEGKLSTVRNIIDVMDKVPNALLSLAGLSVTGNQNISEEDLKKTSNFKFNFLKDDAGIGPRVSLGFIGNQGVFEEGFFPYIDLPVISLTGNLDLNQNAVANENMHGATGVDKLYGRVSGNIRGSIKCGVKGPNGLEDPKLSASFGAAMEAALGWKRNYKEGIEVKSNKLGNVLSKAFENPDFSSKEAFKNSIKLDENDRYVKNNPELKTFIIDEVIDSLELLGVFSQTTDRSGNYKNNTKNLLDTILKGVVEEVKNRNMDELNGKTRLTRLGIFASIGAFIGVGRREKGAVGGGGQGFETPINRNLSVGVEASLSAWKMLYGPDGEKLLYMDESLRSGTGVGLVAKANTKEGLKTAIEDIFNASTITGLTTKVVEKGNGEHQMEIEVSDATLSKYKKNNISELFNIYVKKDQENNIAIEKNKIILGNVGKMNLVSRNYFDEFSLYLLVGGSGVEGCDNNRIKGEKPMSDNMEGISFEKKYERAISSEELKFNYDGFNFGEMDAQTLLELSRVDNQLFNKREGGNFIKAINENRIEYAKVIVLSMLNDFEKHYGGFRGMFDNLKTYLQDNNGDKLRQTLDKIKAIFATTESIHDDKDNVKAYGLKKNLEQRRNTFTTLDKSLELNKNDIDLRDKIVNNIIDGNKYDIVRHDDLIGYTAFYARDNREGRGYSSTSLGNVGVYGNVVEKAASQDNVKEWLKNKIENDGTKQAIIDHVKSKLPDEVKNSITDEQVMNLLFSEEAVVVGDATISMEKAYVFYLLGECANESFGIQLKKINVVMNKEGDTINVGAGGEVLTKTKTLDQKDVNLKATIWNQSIGNGNNENNDPVKSNSDDEGGKMPNSNTDGDEHTNKTPQGGTGSTDTGGGDEV